MDTRTSAAEKTEWSVHFTEETYNKLKKYHESLKSKPSKAGKFLNDELTLLGPGYSWKTLSTEQFCDLLLKTKRAHYLKPETDSKGATDGNRYNYVFCDGTDWNKEEFELLEKMAIQIPCRAYDVGNARADQEKDTHGENGIEVTIMAISAPMLIDSKDEGKRGARNLIVTNKGKLDRKEYKNDLTNRILPSLLAANASAKKNGKNAFITLPGLGLGQFKPEGAAGEEVMKIYAEIIKEILRENIQYLSNIKGIAYLGAEVKETEKISSADGKVTVNFMHVNGVVEPKDEKDPPKTPPLKLPKGYEDCMLFSVMAADPVALPGNDIFGKTKDGKGVWRLANRGTNEGYIGAATNMIAVMFGLEGVRNYGDSTHANYRGFVPQPKDGTSADRSTNNWANVITQGKLKLNFTGRIVVTKSRGNVSQVSLSGNDTIDINAKDPVYGGTFLSKAVIEGNFSKVSELVKLNGIDLNSVDKKGNSALTWALAQLEMSINKQDGTIADRKNIVLALLKAGADTSIGIDALTKRSAAQTIQLRASNPTYRDHYKEIASYLTAAKDQATASINPIVLAAQMPPEVKPTQTSKLADAKKNAPSLSSLAAQASNAGLFAAKKSTASPVGNYHLTNKIIDILLKNTGQKVTAQADGEQKTLESCVDLLNKNGIRIGKDSLKSNFPDGFILTASKDEIERLQKKLDVTISEYKSDLAPTHRIDVNP